ncbi:hypothetical protein IE53DRAFT_394459 [Violaceomyces palustris]|uniref:Uncharacterized protein n=1 Tax=Violaceomyces palustris TaxID=1673888 RepID=A0ACD0NYQ0_9BASI|nr:hypothetical protein IE53DRAFT_394459 [Violaceomyces palustris]
MLAKKAAALLIEAGCPGLLNEEAIERLLIVQSNTATCLTEVEELADAATFVEKGAKEVKLGNEDVAKFTLRRAVTLAESCGAVTSYGIVLLQRAQEEEESHAIDVVQLQKTALQKLVRAYLEASSEDAETLVAAEASLNELIQLYRSTRDERIKDPLQILIDRKAQIEETSKVVEEIASMMGFDDAHINHLIRKLEKMPHEAASRCRQIFLLNMLHRDDSLGFPFVPRILVGILMASKDPRDFEHIEQALEAIKSQPKFSLRADAAFASQLLLWKHGDSFYRKKKYREASRFYGFACNSAFGSMESNIAKSYRKQALCILQDGDAEGAAKAIRSCPALSKNQAFTHFVLFKCASQTRNEAQAIQAIQDLVSAPDFESEMLVVVVEEAQNSDSLDTLAFALDHLLRRLEVDFNLAKGVDSIVLARSLLQIYLPKDDGGFAKHFDIRGLLKHASSTTNILEKLMSGNFDKERMSKEAEWLYKTLYNTALSLAERIDPEDTAGLFEISLKVMKLREQITDPHPDAGLPEMKVWAKLAPCATRALIARETNDDQQARIEHFRCGQDGITECFQLLEAARTQSNDPRFLSEALWALVILDVEALAGMNAWDQVDGKISEIGKNQNNLPIKVLETLADVLWSHVEAPEHILASILQTIVDALTGTGEMDVVRFSRWLRALLSLTLSTSHEVRSKLCDARNHLIKAVEVLWLLQDQDRLQLYPRDELSWLVSTTWQKGIESFKLNKFDRTKEFCEIAIEIANFDSESVVLKSKMQAQFE